MNNQEPVVTKYNWGRYKQQTEYYRVNTLINNDYSVRTVCNNISELIFDLIINWTDFWNEYGNENISNYRDITYQQSVYNFFYKSKNNSSNKLFWSGQVFNSEDETPENILMIVREILKNRKGNIREQIYLWELFYTDCYFNFKNNDLGINNRKRKEQGFGEFPGIFWTIILWVSIVVEEDTIIPEEYNSPEFKKRCLKQIYKNEINVILTVQKIEFLVNYLGVSNIFDIITMENIDNSTLDIILESQENQDFPSICHLSRPFPILRSQIHNISPKLRENATFDNKKFKTDECKYEEPVQNNCNANKCKLTEVSFTMDGNNNEEKNNICIGIGYEMSNLSKEEQIKVIRQQLMSGKHPVILDRKIKSIVIEDKNKKKWLVDLDDDDKLLNYRSIPEYTLEDLNLLGCPLGDYEQNFLGINLSDERVKIPWDIGPYYLNINENSFFYRNALKDMAFLATGISGHAWLIMDVLSNFYIYNSYNIRKKLLAAIISYLTVPLHHTYYEVRWGTMFAGIEYDPKMKDIDDVQMLLDNNELGNKQIELNDGFPDISSVIKISDEKNKIINEMIKELNEICDYDNTNGRWKNLKSQIGRKLKKTPKKKVKYTLKIRKLRTKNKRKSKTK